MDPIIRVEGLSKRYLLRHQAVRREEGLRHAVERALTAPWKTLAERLSGYDGNSGGKSPAHEEFWALRDISFEVKRGEVVGIIGRNGAGKSTLLKILSRITEPTKGRIELDGRVASLLEVGTGFHPELTGRENIFVNGTILGMTRAEVRRKFDEIVAFAEVEKFLDTPVKRYSSGMHVRLAFAVAAHLEPEILIVDEVLAVGDGQFQKKCLGKMRDVSRQEGRTVLFVSHNLAAVGVLCNRGLVLERGIISCDDTAGGAIRCYNQDISSVSNAAFLSRPDRPTITQVQLNEEKAMSGIVDVRIEFVSPYKFRPIPGILVKNSLGETVYGSNPLMHGGLSLTHPLARGTLCVAVDALPLYAGHYSITVFLGDQHHDYDEKRDVVKFEFYAQPLNGAIMPAVGNVGPINWAASWSLAPNDSSVS